MTNSHLLLTGASGYIGNHLARRALAEGRAVTVLGRDDATVPAGARFAPWRLGDELPVFETGIVGAALVHLAHDRSDHEPDGRNFRGTRLLLSGARTQGLSRFVFVSSQSARLDALNAFGRLKYGIEQMIEGPDTVSARVGLVYGGAKKGMYGELASLVGATPLLPMIEPHRLVQPIHIDEVCRGLLALADGGMIGRVALAGPDPITFGDFLRILAQEGFAAALTILPIPLRAALLAAALSERLPFGPKVEKERILGLAGTQLLDSRGDLQRLGLDLAAPRLGMRRDVIGRKARLIEARALLTYILGEPPRGSLLRRYVRGVAQIDPEAGALALPRLALRFPGVLRLYEPLRPSSVLAARLRVALALAELSTEGAAVIARTLQGSRWRRIGRAVVTVAVDLLLLPLRLVSPKN